MRVVVQPRKHNRYRVGVPVIFSWHDGKEARREAVGLTRDISLGGAFVFTASPPPLEVNVHFKAFLPQTPDSIRSVWIHGQGLVIRVEPVHKGETTGGFAVVGKRFVLRQGEEDQCPKRPCF